MSSNEKGLLNDIPLLGVFIYPFFLIHVGIFGGGGLLMAYFSDTSLTIRLMFAGISIGLYLLFYLIFFGKDSVKWIIINSMLGVIGIYSELQWILLSLFEINISDYSFSVNAVPFIYYVMYTFLIYQMVLSISGSRNNPKRKKMVESLYIIISLALSLYTFLSV